MQFPAAIFAIKQRDEAGLLASEWIVDAKLIAANGVSPQEADILAGEESRQLVAASPLTKTASAHRDSPACPKYGGERAQKENPWSAKMLQSAGKLSSPT
jgi:hypothetical protein